MVLSREGYVYVEGIACYVTDDLLFKSGDKLTGAESKVILLALSALEGNAVNGALVVDNCDIALSRCAVGDVNGAGVAGANLLDLRVYFLLGGGSNGSRYLITLVFLNGNLRLYGEGRLKNNAVVVKRNDIELRLTYGSLAALGNSFVVCLGKKRVNSLIIEYALTVHLFNYGTGSLSLSEAGNVHILNILSVCSFDCLVKALLVDSDFDIDLISYFVCAFQAHFVFSSDDIDIHIILPNFRVMSRDLDEKVVI